MNTVDVSALSTFARSLLSAGGFTAKQAQTTAEVLVWADARGTSSHGVLRIPRYVEMVEKRLIDPGATIETEKSDGAIAVLNANRSPGASAMLTAMNRAIASAQSSAIGWCSVKNISHAGAVGYFALKAAEQNMIGIVLSASKPLMAYHGARDPGLSTNPISIAVPKTGEALLLDMSTSTVALGKIMFAKDSNNDIPPDWAIDETGAATTDPHRVHTLTPLGGPKGSGLSLMIEILASVLVSNPAISTALSGEKSSMNGVALALDIARFCNPDTFTAQIEELVAGLKSLPVAVGVDTILMPGERGFALSKERMHKGIPLADGTRERLAALANKLDVSVPNELQTEFD